RKDRKRREAEARNQIAPLRAAMRRIETELERHNTRRAELERTLADPDFYVQVGAAEQRTTTEAHGQLLKEIAALENRWLEIGESIEAAGK
ncbi:MAG: hypothetical protein RL603_1141, partial [Pseudomonadota bacterium]